MAALENYHDEMKAERRAERDPVSRLAKSLNVPNNTGTMTITGTTEGRKADGTPITLVLPVLAVNGGDIPPAELMRAMPDLQRYYFRAFSKYMRPVYPNELMLKE